MIHYIYTFRELVERRNQMKYRVREQAQRLREKANALFVPKEKKTGLGRWMTYTDMAFAVYDGATLGYKLFSRLRAHLPLWHKKETKSSDKRKRVRNR